MNNCPCGKGGDFYSALLEQVFCSEKCYTEAMKAARDRQTQIQERINNVYAPDTIS